MYKVYFLLLIVVFVSIILLSYRINNLNNINVSKDIGYRHTLYLSGESWASMGAIVLCLAYFYFFGCASCVVYCIEKHASDANHYTSSLESSYHDEAAYKLKALKVEAQKASKILGVHLYIVYVEGYGYMAYDPTSLQAFYGLDGKGVLRPHFNLYNAFLNAEGKLERHPTSNDTVSVTTDGKNIFQCIWKWIDFGPTEVAPTPVETGTSFDPQLKENILCYENLKTDWEKSMFLRSFGLEGKHLFLKNVWDFRKYEAQLLNGTLTPQSFFNLDVDEQVNILHKLSLNESKLEAYKRQLFNSPYSTQKSSKSDTPMTYNTLSDNYVVHKDKQLGVAEKYTRFFNLVDSTDEMDQERLCFIINNEGFLDSLREDAVNITASGNVELGKRVYETYEKLYVLNEKLEEAKASQLEETKASNNDNV